MDFERNVVGTALGPIEGNRRTSFMGDRFFSFRAVPYARPPVGELRFKVGLADLGFIDFISIYFVGQL